MIRRVTFFHRVKMALEMVEMTVCVSVFPIKKFQNFLAKSIVPRMGNPVFHQMRPENP